MIGRRGVLRGAIGALLLAVTIGQPLEAAQRYDPRLKFRTLSTPRFDIHFHQGEEAMARRLARIVEEVADRLTLELGAADGRVHVILVDQTDLSNGWATPIPRNTIEITAVVPPGESGIGNTDDWLRLVFSHEYTHIVHLDMGRGWIGGLRGVFGRVPVLYPNLALPLWQIEGFATYKESAVTGAGRVPAGDFRMIVDRAAAAGRFDPLDRASGGLVDWPSGTAQYAYGAYFHQYLSDRFGPASLVKLAGETSGRLPYFGARAFRKVYGKPLGALWDDFEADTIKRAREDTSTRTRLTRHGFAVSAPRFDSSGQLFYATVNPHGFPALMALPAGATQPRQVATKFLGGQISFAGASIVFDQIDFIRNVGLQSDLYVVSASGGPTRRLTEGARAADPDVAPDGRTIVCTVQSLDRRSLATLTLPAAGRAAAPIAIVSEPSTEFAGPRWSPDGATIAAERRRLGGRSEIVLVDAATHQVRTIVSSASGRNVGPAWTRDGSTILFASDRNGEPFGVYSVEVATGRTRRLSGAGPSAQSPAIAPDGQRLVFVGYTPDGYDLFSLPLDSATWIDEPGDRGEPDERREPPAPDESRDPVEPVRAFNPFRSAAPTFWLPILDSDSGEFIFGAGTGGADVLGRHSYFANLTWSTRLRPDWNIGYAYDRWWPTIVASISDDTDPFRAGDVRTREFDAGALFPVRHVRRSQTVYAGVHASSDVFDCAACRPVIDVTIARRAVRLGWAFSNARSFGYSVSNEEGAFARVTSETFAQAVGGDGAGGALTADVRGYARAFVRHGAFAGRLAAATSWGDDLVRRNFSAAGPGPQAGGFDFGRDAIGLLRGFNPGQITGEHVVVGNLDYRFPIAYIQRGAGTFPFFLRTIHAALYADAGQAWSGTFRAGDLKSSFGAELSLDGVAAYVLPLTFTAGAGWRHDGASGQREFVTFGRIGRAF